MTEARAWEFWPAWFFYAPVGVFVAALSARYGLRALPAANPGLRYGGLVGESKAEILGKLPAQWTIPFELVTRGPSTDAALARVSARGWSYPLVEKPDVGQRGVGVKRIRNQAELQSYLHSYAGDVVVHLGIRARSRRECSMYDDPTNVTDASSRSPINAFRSSLAMVNQRSSN